MAKKKGEFARLRERLERLNERQREIVAEKRRLIPHLRAACWHDSDIYEAAFDQIWISNTDADPVYPARLCISCGFEEQLSTSESFDHFYKKLNRPGAIRISRDEYNSVKTQAFRRLGID